MVPITLVLCFSSASNLFWKISNRNFNYGTYIKEGLKQNQRLIDPNVQELLNSVTRIENSVATLYLRQLTEPNNNKAFSMSPLSQILDELSAIMKHVQDT